MSEQPESAASLVRRLEEFLPYPMAVALKRYRDIPADRYSERTDALLKVFEICVKMLAVIVAKNLLLDGAPDDAFRKNLQDFRRPSLGHWIQLLRSGLRPYEKIPASGVIDRIRSWYEKNHSSKPGLRDDCQALCESISLEFSPGKLQTHKIIDILAAYRNRSASGHGAGTTEETNRSRHSCVLNMLMALASDLDFMREFTLGYVEEVKVRGGEYFYSVRVCTGRDIELRNIRAQEPLQDLRLYCFQFGADGVPAFALDLSHFMVFRACPVCKTDQVFFFNKAEKNIEYLSYQCGHFLIANDPSGELASIDRFLSGQLSLYGLFHGKALGREITPGRVGASKENRQKSEECTAVARDLQKKGLFLDAITSINQALAFDPDSGQAHLALGLSRLGLGEPSESVIPAFQKAVELAPDSAEAQYALGRVACFYGNKKLAGESFIKARSLNPSSQLYQRYAEKAGEEDLPSDEVGAPSGVHGSMALAGELLADNSQLLPKINYWLVAVPPWSWVESRPLLGSLALSFGLFLAVLLVNVGRLSTLSVVWYLNIAALCFLGLYFPFVLPRFIERLYQQICSVVTLPPETFRRWFLAELIPFVGSAHMEGSRYSLRQMVSRDRSLVLMFWAGFLVFIPFQTACAMGMDPFRWELPALARYLFYYFEVYSLSWIPIFVIRALKFIPGFSRLPIRHFIEMPDSVSLKPLGTFYLKIAAVGALAFALFTSQHYFFRTHITVPFASIAFIGIVYALFFAIMFASQAVIMKTMAELRSKRLIEYSLHLEKAFQSMMRDPTENALKDISNHQKYMRVLRRGLKISGLTRVTLLWFLGLAAAEIAIMAAYLYLVMNQKWIQ